MPFKLYYFLERGETCVNDSSILVHLPASLAAMTWLFEPAQREMLEEGL